ncbi:TXNDC5 [Cordylochernes scorpioides]|uniref:Flavin-containing monooxygenase n=1 Tax=Cordylochernes scorpioides TaxID=51811 RepID=A0ABY6LKQ8_9ARAC|nr:TXNDC5 [Cordylochernes scorpioides]
MAARGRICVIGAGFSGLTAIKNCRDEDLDVICFEAQDEVGGLWRYREETEEGYGSVMPFTISNTSKEMSSASDFIIPEHLPNYMHNKELYGVIKEYAKKFGLYEYIRFKHRVEKVVKASDYESTGRWEVEVKDLQSGEVIKDIFGAVLVCAGHHTTPLWPEFQDQELFHGKILHSHGYRIEEGFKNKRVAIVGAGNSAMDIAVELTRSTKQVYLSTRRGFWLTPRVGPWGIPFDLLFLTRFFNLIFNLLPWNFVNSLFETYINFHVNHKAYGIKPSHRYIAQHPTLIDSLPSYILSGIIRIKGNIERFTQNGVIFQNETDETPLDAVVFCTGYRMAYPFIEDIKFPDNKVELYKFIFPPGFQHPTLAFMGLFQIVGAGFPSFDMQGRWVAKILNGKLGLPPKSEMVKDIQNSLQESRNIFGSSPNHTVHVYYLNYMDDLAERIGCKPNLLRMLFRDPKLFMYCFFGPCLAYQYRLEGPDSWEGARDAIMKYKKRLHTPLKSTRMVQNEKKTKYFSFKLIFIGFIILFWMYI